MLKSLFASALFAGVAAGLLAALLQMALLVPLIAEAELYETGEKTHFGEAGPAHAAMRFLAPSTSTRQILQAPVGAASACC